SPTRRLPRPSRRAPSRPPTKPRQTEPPELPILPRRGKQPSQRGKPRSLRREFPMIKTRCPICDRLMEGEGTADWPDLPFCSQRCRLIDLGRWMGEGYRIEPETEGEAPAEHSDDSDYP